jgi:transcriptional regulator with XRE-family HTH domain
MPLLVPLGHLPSCDVTEDERAFRLWFGQRIRAARERRGLSQNALARMLPPPIESGTIGGWERGEVFPRPANIAAILTALETTPESLFCER